MVSPALYLGPGMTGLYFSAKSGCRGASRRRSGPPNSAKYSPSHLTAIIHLFHPYRNLKQLSGLL